MMIQCLNDVDEPVVSLRHIDFRGKKEASRFGAFFRVRVRPSRDPSVGRCKKKWPDFVKLLVSHRGRGMAFRI